MIRSFKCKATERLFHDESVKRFKTIEHSARRKLELLDAAINLNVLSMIPGNRLEKLKGNRKGRWSMRINEKWRICFIWQGQDAFEVEICDYHK